MSLFEVGADRLSMFREPAGGAGAYDRVVAEVLWSHLEQVLGEPLLRVRQRPQIADGSPTIVALDSCGAVVVVHARAEIDRTDLTDCLEYAGWARAASADQIADLYWRGSAEFWADWRAFAPGGLAPGAAQARLKLVTAQFAGRSGATFDYLVDSGVPVQVVRASLYEDERGRRLLDVRPQEELRPLEPRAADEPISGMPAASASATRTTVDLPAEMLSRARAASERSMASGALGGEILPPLDITAEQLRNDPLGVDQIVLGRLTAVEPGTPGPQDNPFAPPPPSAPMPVTVLPVSPEIQIHPHPDEPPAAPGHFGDAAPAARPDGPSIIRYDAPPPAIPRFEPAPHQPAVGLDAAPGQPFALPGSPSQPSEAAGFEPAEQHTRLPGSAPDARPADARPYEPAPFPSGTFGLPAESAPYEESTERSAAAPFPSGSFTPPAEPAPYQPYGEPPSVAASAEAAPFPSGSFTPPVEPAPFSPSEPFRPRPAPSEPAARPPHVVEVGEPVQPVPVRPDGGAAPFGQPAAFGGSSALDGPLPFAQPADTGPQFAGVPPMAGGSADGPFGRRGAEQPPFSSQPMPQSGAPRGATAADPPPSNVIPLGGRTTAPPEAAWRAPEAPQQQIGAHPQQSFAGPAFRLPGLPASPAPFGAERGSADAEGHFAPPQGPDPRGGNPQFDPLTSGSFGGPPPLGADHRGTDELPSFGRPTSGGPSMPAPGLPPGPPPSSERQAPLSRSHAHQAPEPPRVEFPTGAYPRSGEPAAPPRPQGLPPVEPLPRRVPGVFGGGPQPPMRGAHADRGPQFAGFEPPDPDADDPDRIGNGEPYDQRMQRVPDAPSWDEHGPNGYERGPNGYENGRGNH